MSTPTKTLDNGKVQLSERELEILSNAWKCMKNQPEIDYTKLASECGMTNIRSASNAWSNIKKKLFSDLPSASPTSAKKRKTSSKTTPKGKKNGDDGEAADDDEEPETPTVKRGRKVKKEKKEEEPEEENEDKSEVKKEEPVDTSTSV